MKGKVGLRSILVMLSIVSLTGCDFWTHPLNERYSLSAIDTLDTMSLCHEVSEGGHICAAPSPVVAVGLDDSSATLKVCRDGQVQFHSYRLPETQYGEFLPQGVLSEDEFENLDESRKALWPEIQFRLERLERNFCPSEG